MEANSKAKTITTLSLSAGFERRAHGVPSRTGFQGGSTRAEEGLVLFSDGGEDTVAPFTVYGQVMPGRSVRVVKLYPDCGWTYQGRIRGDEGGGWCLEGQWGPKFSGPPGGYFMLKSWARNLQTLY